MLAVFSPVLDQFHQCINQKSGSLEAEVSSSPPSGLEGLYEELVEQERNTERAGHTGTKDATVGASSSGTKASQPAFELVLVEISQEFVSGKPSPGNRM